ncbi:MAG: LuxR C-terminal-related transcriptional regulator [Acidimicrobiales bacterium]
MGADVTARERAILELVTTPGGTLRSAATVLGISERTVGRQLKTLCARLGVKTAAQAMRLVLDRRTPLDVTRPARPRAHLTP